MTWEWMLIAGLAALAAAGGWLIFKRGADTAGAKPARNIPPEYLKGLNYVLNEQQDKAIELFIKMLEVDSDTVETHLALGHLFRRRGETDRAIRIHQNLIARPTLSADHRSLALLELGTDYMRSGLLDRAESLFKELLNDRVYAAQANSRLLEIYQQEQEWDKAIAVAQRLQSLNGEDWNPVIAQFYCELADRELAANRTGAALALVGKALRADPHCTRASILEAEGARRQGQISAALKIYQRIKNQDPAFLPEVIAPIIACHRELGQLRGCVHYLRELIREYDGVTPLLHLTALVEETEGRQAAIRFISQELKRRPSVRGVDKLLEYVLDMAEGEIKDNLHTIKDMIGRLLSGSPIYKCQQCGFDAKRMHWYCPSCKHWATIKPIVGVSGE